MESPRATDRSRLVSRTRAIDGVPLVSAFDALEGPRTVWAAPDGELVVCGGTAATLSSDGPGRFEQVRAGVERLFASGDVHARAKAARPRVFGGFAFHDEPAGQPPWRGFPGARFVFPRVQLTVADGRSWLTVNAVGPDATPGAVERRLVAERDRLASLPERPRGPRPGIKRRRRTTDRGTWQSSVRRATDRIRSGELEKVVLAQALEVETADELRVADVLDRLRERHPGSYLFCFEPGGGSSFFGATPERLVSLRGRTVGTGALAGTTGRGDTPAEDEWLAEELLADPKNAEEHRLVVDAIRRQLDPHAASVSVGDRRVRRLSTVQHLWTPVTAELADDEHVVSLVEALHPTPAVGGLPPDRAFDAIEETEPFDRGWYAAPVGWIDAAGDGEFAVALRSAAAVDRTATLFAGVGIVADSDPDREWDEVQLKFRPVLDELRRDE